MISEVFYEVIKEAANACVLIDGEEWPVGFNTCIINNNEELKYTNEENISGLIIKNLPEFLYWLERYVELELEYNRKTPTFVRDEERNHIKWIITYLFTNATTEDLVNPVEFIKRRMKFLKDETFAYLNEGVDIDIGGYFLDSRLNLKNSVHSISMETPYRIDVNLVNDIDDKKVSYPLASISYGIEEKDGVKVCYIYSLMKPRTPLNMDEDSRYYAKKMTRMLYKINDGIAEYENDEYFEYKEGNSKIYPEANISDVTPSFVVSLNAFIALLQKEGIEKIYAIPNFPIRYLSRELTANSVIDEEKRYQLKQRNQNIQENITNKFIRTFRRMCFHNPDLHVTSLPYEVSEYLEMHLREKLSFINNPILKDMADNIYNKDYRKGYKNK